MSEIFDHIEALKRIPSLPGVYLMKDKQGVVIYIGKAKDLHARVRQYFTGHDSRGFVSLLGGLLDRIDVILASTEKEALILESSLIKQYRPKFNVVLRDDKEMLQLRLDLSEEWPRVRVVRQRKKDGAHYFGPYPSAASARQVLSLLNKYFQLRSCKDSFFKNRVRACLQYEIKRCLGPCVYEIDREAYLQKCREVMLFLSGRYECLVEGLREKMEVASENLAFEDAAKYRDQIASIEHVYESQRVVQDRFVNQDYFALYREGEEVCVAVMIVRGGRLIRVDGHQAVEGVGLSAELMSQVILHHYEKCGDYPKEILVEDWMYDEIEVLEEVLGEMSSHRVHVVIPKRGSKLQLLETAKLNAKQQFEQSFRRSQGDILMKLKERLGLVRVPRRIECYDISNLGVSGIVASMVVFIDGRLDASRCRRFKIKEVEGQNDFQSMHEVIFRRMKYLLLKEDVQGCDFKESLLVENAEIKAWLDKRDERRNAASERQFMEEPDLVIIDGGRGQLRYALSALESLGLKGRFDVIALTESRSEHALREREVFHSVERIFFEGSDALGLVLAQDSEEHLFLQRIRNETHNRAVGFQRARRKKEGLVSKLDGIDGIGLKRKSRLLKVFGSVGGMLGKSAEEISEKGGIPLSVAEKVVLFLNKA